MNNVLNLNRLWLLVRRQAVENYKFYLLAIALMAGLLVIVYILSFRSLGHDGSPQQIWFYFSLVLSGTVFTNMLLKELHSTTTSIWYLTFPVSALEKLLVVIFYSFLLFVPLHLLVFYAIDSSFVNYYNSYYTDGKHGKAVMLSLYLEQRLTIFYYSFYIFQAVALVGSLWFKQYSYIKTAATLFGLVIVFYFLNSVILSSIIPEEVSNTLPFRHVGIVSGKEADQQWIFIPLPSVWQEIVDFVSKFLLTPCLLVIAYFRLRETQIH